MVLCSQASTVENDQVPGHQANGTEPKSSPLMVPRQAAAPDFKKCKSIVCQKHLEVFKSRNELLSFLFEEPQWDSWMLEERHEYYSTLK